MNNIAKLVVLGILRAYKWAISPMFPPACRYVPTCSEYAMEAVDRYGAVRGSWMALLRLLRCHPFVKGGYDPVVKVERVRYESAIRNVKHGFDPATQSTMNRSQPRSGGRIQPTA